jgi:hypothetical protein
MSDFFRRLWFVLIYPRHVPGLQFFRCQSSEDTTRSTVVVIIVFRSNEMMQATMGNGGCYRVCGTLGGNLGNLLVGGTWSFMSQLEAPSQRMSQIGPQTLTDLNWRLSVTIIPWSGALALRIRDGKCYARKQQLFALSCLALFGSVILWNIESVLLGLLFGRG